MSFLPLAPGELVRIRDQRWVVTRQTATGRVAVLDVLGRDRANREERASFLLPFEIVERLPSSDRPRPARRRLWRRLVRPMLAGAAPSWQALRAPLAARISLLPFQLEPALAVTHGIATRLLIADEVGLGKTIQAALVLAELLARRRHGRVLIVAPASLKEQWQSELRERFGIDAWVADSSTLAQFSASWRGVDPWAAHAVTITSIDFVKRPEVMRSLESFVWDAIVFDEAHGLTGRSDRALAANTLATRGRTVVLLTATPHDGDDAAFASLCRIGDSSGEFPLLVFRRTRQELGVSMSRRTVRLRVRPTLAELAMHRALAAYAHHVRAERGAHADAAHLAMTVLTRRACSSAASLARSIERRLALLRDDEAWTEQLRLPMILADDDDEPGLELAAPGLEDRGEERRRLHHVLRLAHGARPAESKLRVLIRLLSRTSEPVIVFTQYRDTLARLADALQAWTPAALHGGMTVTERRDSVRRFTTGNARLLLATDAASEGLNLHHRCRLVINLELPWTPLRVEQRIGRVERLGQTRRVHAVHFLLLDTSEESYAARFLARTDRATDALEALRPGVSASPSSGHGISAAAIHPIAGSEAARIQNLRHLCPSVPDATVATRPPVSVRRRRGGVTLIGFHVSFTDAAQQFEWKTLIGIYAHSAHVVAAGMPPPQAVLEAQERILEDVRHALHSYGALAIRREQAIAGLLEREHARLSVRLLQSGLFDRRAERALSAQATTLQDALLRCRARLDELETMHALRSTPPRPAFALLAR